MLLWEWYSYANYTENCLLSAEDGITPLRRELCVGFGLVAFINLLYSWSSGDLHDVGDGLPISANR